MSDFFDFLLSYFQLQPEYLTGETDWFLTISIWFVGLVVLGCILAPIFFAVCFAWRKAMWIAKRERCQHGECGHQWTLEVAEDEYPSCIVGKPCCNDCFDRHEGDAFLRRVEAEPVYNCVDGHGPMQKVVVEALNGKIVIDECGQCGGVWLDRHELDAIERLAERRGYSCHSDSGQLALGIAIGTAI